MFTIRTIAWIVGLLSIIVWRNGRTAKNNMFLKHDFPVGYYSEGNFDTACTTLKAPELKYCEDITLWDFLDGAGKFVDRSVLISCDGNRKSWNTVMGPLRDPKPHGSLFIYEPRTNAKSGKLSRIELKGYPAGHDFHPLGLEIFPSYGGNASNLYVVNHARARTVIEQFVVSPTTPTVATHVRTITSPYFISPNGLALTSPDSFYVTNDHLMTRRLPIVGDILSLLESTLALPLGFVSHITLSPTSKSNSESTVTPTIQSHKFAIPFVPFANGITMSPDHTHVAMASTTLSQVNIYTRDPATNALTFIQSVPVPFLPDNVLYTHDGSALIVGGHPNFPDLAAVAKNVTGALAPSWIASISVPNDKTSVPKTPVQNFDAQAPLSAKGMVPPVSGYELKTLFQSDGSGFMSSSTGIVDIVTGALYISGLYAEEGVMVCQPA